MELTGRRVFAIFASGFAIIIAVNVTLAVQAVRTFPGLETRNAYVVSQRFDADRAAQRALGWQVAATLRDGMLRLTMTNASGDPVQPAMLAATLGRATNVSQDETPVFAFDGTHHVAAVAAGPGRWDLRLTATAADGTPFRQRIILHGEAGS